MFIFTTACVHEELRVEAVTADSNDIHRWIVVLHFETCHIAGGFTERWIQRGVCVTLVFTHLTDKVPPNLFWHRLFKEVYVGTFGRMLMMDGDSEGRLKT